MNREENKKFRHYVYYHMPWQVMMLVIFFLSSLSNDMLPDFSFKLSDKLVHFIVFGILGFLMARSIYQFRGNFWRDKFIFWSILISSIYAASDEIHQSFVPGRFAGIGDWIADILGIVIFVWVYSLKKH